jgi:multiple sugar transport system permease protein
MVTQNIAAPAPVAVKRRRVGRQRRSWIGWILTAPFGVVFVAFLVVPLGYALWMSLRTNSLIGGDRWVGGENYLKALQDPLFLKGVLLVIGFTIVLVPIQMLVSLSAALVLDSLTSRFAKVSRLIIFVPYAVPAVIGALMWGFLYSPNFGPLKDLFSLFGADAPNLLASGNVFGALVNIVTWQWAGYYMIIIYAALKGIDPTVYEAAKLDGASALQIAFRIKVPMVSSALVLILVFAIIGTLQFFTEPQILKPISGGSIDAAYTPNMYAYSTAFSYGQFNYALAISFVLGAVVFIGSAIFMTATRKRSGITK